MAPALWCVLFVLLGFADLARAQESVRDADAVCETCHRDIYRSYVATPMANASGLASDRFFPGKFTHAPSGVQYEVSRKNGAATLSYRDPADPHIAGAHPLQYFLGSGHLGTTYLYTQDGYLMESPVAWYSATKTYDMKPGFGGATELPAALPMEPGCLRCHMSGVADAEPGSRNRYAGLPFAQGGITCESCHGDTAAHVQSHGKAPVVNPAKLSAERRDAVCMSCHLEGNVTITRAGQDPLRYQPGDCLSDFLSFFVLTSGDPLARGVSEVEQFSTSRCKRVSGDRMSCDSCHDPHGSPTGAQRVVFFRAKCLSCHSAPAFAAAHHPENPDCTSCHMPTNGAENTPHVAWTDHRILRDPGKQLPSPPSAELATLKPIFSPQADQRDLALALYNTLMAGDLRDPQPALRALKEAYAAGAHDEALLEALGSLSAMMGDAASARPVLEALLRSDPRNLAGLSNLGLYAFRAGDDRDALQLWNSAFSRNAYDLDLGHKLAVANCALGNSDEAKRVLLQALSFSPGNRAAWKFTCGPR